MSILYFPKPSEKSNQVFGLETMMSGDLKNLSAEWSKLLALLWEKHVI
jgi:hypothetical protein